MTTMTLHPLAARYLDDLRDAGRRLPRAVMRDLEAEIESHLAEATDPEMADAEVLTVLDRLGDPKDIIAAQEPDPDLPDRARGMHEWAAIFLLLFGGFIFGFGWIGGLVLLWSSPLWAARDRWIGTLVVPGGLAASVVFYLAVVSQRTCVSMIGFGFHAFTPLYCGAGPSTAVRIVELVGLGLLILGPIATAVFLARRARPR